jgi:hypothetical protein
MLETILMWFPRYRELRKKLARAEKCARNAELRAQQAQRRCDEMVARFDRECEEHKADLRKITDTFSKPITGRYTFSRASDEISVAVEQKPVPSRPMAHDVKQQRTRQFFKDLLNGHNAGDNGTADAA